MATRFGLGVKFNFTIAIILAIAMAFNLLQYLKTMSSFHEQQLVQRGTALGDLISLVSPDAILGYNFVLLSEYSRVVSSQPDVLYSVILNDQGIPMASHVNRSDPFIQKNLDRSTLGDMVKLVKKLETLDYPEELIKLEFSIVHDGKQIGRFLVGISRQQMNTQLHQQLIIQVSIFAGMILFLSLAIYIVFRRNIMRPINQLITASRDLGHGEHNVVQTNSNDELGLLAKAFNTMADEVKAEQAKLYEQANFDSLTHLPNRAMAINRIERAINRAQHKQQRLAVLFIDLDDFKVVNDSLGHAAGDQLLVEIGSRLTANLRDVDTIARLGGDEFLVLMHNVVNLDEIEKVVDRLLMAVTKPMELAGRTMVIHCSVGIATYPENGRNAEELMANADNAMYQAKESDRLRYSFFTAEMNTKLNARLHMEQDLLQALEKGQLMTYFQPIVDTAGRHQGAEVLLRWNHPERGFISPVDFIPIAESTGQIIDIGEWVVSEACRLWSKWSLADIYPGYLAVNISRVQFRNNLPDRVEKLMVQYGVPPDALALEITESVLLDDHDRLVEELDRIKTMGIRLSLDDFGTGYSSLSYLKRFAFDMLKIDRSFITGLPSDPDDCALVGAIVAMADSLGLKVVAEGVETNEQLRFLATHGCTYAQGFLFSKPLNEEDYCRYLKRQGRMLLVS